MQNAKCKGIDKMETFFVLFIYCVVVVVVDVAVLPLFVISMVKLFGKIPDRIKIVTQCAIV